MTEIMSKKHHHYYHQHHPRRLIKMKSSLVIYLIITIMISGVASHGKLFVGFLTYSGHENRDYTESCCDGNEINGRCIESCDLIFQVSVVGLDGHNLTNRRLSSFPTSQSGDIIFSLPVLMEQTVNPVMFHFDRWQQEVKVAVQVFDADFKEESPPGQGVLQLVDEIEHTVELTQPSDMYVCVEVTSLRRTKTRLKIALRYTCDPTYGGPFCATDCVMTPWQPECPTWQDHGQPPGFNGIASQANHYFGNPLARCPLKPVTPKPTPPTYTYPTSSTMHQSPSPVIVSTPSISYDQSTTSYSGVEPSSTLQPSKQQTVSQYSNSVTADEISQPLSTIYSSSSSVDIEHSVTTEDNLISKSLVGSLSETQTLVPTPSSPATKTTMFTTSGTRSLLVTTTETLILPSVTDTTILRTEGITVTQSRRSSDFDPMAPSATMTVTSGQSASTPTVRETISRDSVQTTTLKFLQTSDLTTSFGDISSTSDDLSATMGSFSTPYLSGSISHSILTSDSILISERSLTDGRTSSQNFRPSEIDHSSTQDTRSSHSLKPTQTGGTDPPSKSPLVEPTSMKKTTTPKDGGVNPPYTTALPNSSDDDDDDPMQYWAIIVGSILGGLAMLATLGYIIYRSRQTALQKRQEIYTVTPQMMSAIEENGTSGRSDVPMTTALL